jgi:hypothetical protein
MRLEINTTPAIINIETKNATLDKSAIPENVLDIKAEKFSVSMETEEGTLDIDQNQCFNEAGLKDIRAFMDDYVNYSKQAASDGVDRIVSEGNSFADIQNDSDAFAQNADNNAFGIFEHEYNLDFIPKSRPKIQYSPAKLNIDYEPGEIINNSIPKDNLGEYTPGKVDIYMKQKNSIEINFVRDEFDELV